MIYLPLKSNCINCVKSNNEILQLVIQHGPEIADHLTVVLLNPSDNTISSDLKKEGFHVLSVEDQSQIFKEEFRLNYPALSVMDKHSTLLNHEVLSNEVFARERQHAFWHAAIYLLNQTYP
ncbi:MAG: hypothetical protein FH748_17065 [Balneolaceae bacterium]|nr:hypothetical protein [Balneolaceae bacterium]